jgi:thioredoxin:protein disulfide reductase
MRSPLTAQARRLPCLCLLPLLLAWLGSPAWGQEFLPVKAAYQVTTAVEAGRIVVHYEIAPGYYLYRDKLGFETATPGVTLGRPSLPVGLDHEDEFFGRQVIYRDVADVGVPATFDGPPRDIELQVKLQGCADAGLCYPPQTWPVRVTWPAGVGEARPAAMAAADRASTAAPTAAPKKRFDLRSLLGARSGAKSDADFLLPDQAFVLSATSPSRDLVRLRWDVADEYYLYRDKTQATTTTVNARLGGLVAPGGETQVDEYFGEQVVFRG